MHGQVAVDTDACCVLASSGGTLTNYSSLRHSCGGGVCRISPLILQIR